MYRIAGSVQSLCRVEGRHLNPISRHPSVVGRLRFGGRDCMWLARGVKNTRDGCLGILIRQCVCHHNCVVDVTCSHIFGGASQLLFSIVSAAGSERCTNQVGRTTNKYRASLVMPTVEALLHLKQAPTGKV